MKAECNVCPRHCRIADGAAGFCKARKNEQGQIVCKSYGRLTALALDPIEKKPLRRFHPGSLILSAGSYGCNMRCSFCQNHSISMNGEEDTVWRFMPPEDLAAEAVMLREKGNIGLAFTYNEPCVGFEYVRDTARLVHEAGMKNVLVTNGCAEGWVLDELLPHIDAMNIDLKAFTEGFYRRHGGSLETVKAFIKKAAASCHVELTTLVIPGENDDMQELKRMVSWIAGISPKIPLHVSRFFPQWKMKRRDATDISTIYSIAEMAAKQLKYVYTGNC